MELVLDAGVDDFEVVDVEGGVLEVVNTEIEVDVDIGGAVVVETVDPSVLAGGGVELEGDGG